MVYTIYITVHCVYHILHSTYNIVYTTYYTLCSTQHMVYSIWYTVAATTYTVKAYPYMPYKPPTYLEDPRPGRSAHSATRGYQPPQTAATCASRPHTHHRRNPHAPPLGVFHRHTQTDTAATSQ